MFSLFKWSCAVVGYYDATGQEALSAQKLSQTKRQRHQKNMQGCAQIGSHE